MLGPVIYVKYCSDAKISNSNISVQDMGILIENCGNVFLNSNKFFDVKTPIKGRDIDALEAQGNCEISKGVNYSVSKEKQVLNKSEQMRNFRYRDRYNLLSADSISFCMEKNREEKNKNV